MGQAYTRLGAKFKASVKDGEGREGTLPAGRWGWFYLKNCSSLDGSRSVRFLSCFMARFAVAVQFLNTFLFLCFHSCPATSMLHPALSGGAIEMDRTRSLSPTVRKTS